MSSEEIKLPEFKKQIRLKQNTWIDNKTLLGVINVPTVDDVIDKARDEVLKFVSGLGPNDPENVGDIAMAINLLPEQFAEWFVRWFLGENEHSPLEVQVVPGCAGHIDLGKVQNIEKEP